MQTGLCSCQHHHTASWLLSAWGWPVRRLHSSSPTPVYSLQLLPLHLRRLQRRRLGRRALSYCWHHSICIKAVLAQGCRTLPSASLSCYVYPAEAAHCSRFVSLAVSEVSCYRLPVTCISRLSAKYSHDCWRGRRPRVAERQRQPSMEQDCLASWALHCRPLLSADPRPVSCPRRCPRP